MSRRCGGRSRRSADRDDDARGGRARSRLPRNEFDEAVDRFVDQARETLLRTAGQVLDQASDAMERPARSAASAETSGSGIRGRSALDPELRRQAEPLFGELESEIKRLKLAARDLHEERRSGFDRKLHRNPYRARIGGVCAGLADYFDRETWFIRIAVVTGAVFFPGIVIPAYVVAYFLLDAAPRHDEEAERLSQRRRGRALRSRPRAEDARVVMRSARGRVQAVEKRLQRLEGYVTSPRYVLDRELGSGAADGPSRASSRREAGQGS